MAKKSRKQRKEARARRLAKESAPRPNKCKCSCHDGANIFCSCFGPCCQEPYVARRRLKPIMSFEPYPIGDFTKFVFPIIRAPGMGTPKEPDDI